MAQPKVTFNRSNKADTMRLADAPSGAYIVQVPFGNLLALKHGQHVAYLDDQGGVVIARLGSVAAPPDEVLELHDITIDVRF